MTVTTLDLEGRHAVVTGAGSGIGLAVCSILTSRGARVTGLDLNANALERASREGLLDVAIPTDVADREAVRLAAVRVASAGRPLDMLVNAAGILVRGGVEDLDDEAWDRQFAVNVKSVVHTTREFLPALRLSSHASVVNVGSDASTGGERGADAYVASKHAVLGLTRALALTHGPEGIRFNTVCPSMVDTPMARTLFEETPGALEYYERIVPLARLATADEVAEAIVFLLSEAARYINGAAIPVDGGATTGHFLGPRQKPRV